MKKKSFTLVEIMIVVAIIAILAAIAVPSLSANRDTAIEQTKVANVKMVDSAIATYLAAHVDQDRSDITAATDIENTLKGYLSDKFQKAADFNVGKQKLKITATEVTYEDK